MSGRAVYVDEMYESHREQLATDTALRASAGERLFHPLALLAAEEFGYIRDGRLTRAGVAAVERAFERGEHDGDGM